MQIRETVKTLRESGGLHEISEAVSIAAMAARDTAKDINETAKELQEKGVIDDTVNAISETASTTKDTVKQFKGQASRAAENLKGARQDLQETGKDLKEMGQGLKEAVTDAPSQKRTSGGGMKGERESVQKDKEKKGGERY
jgi:ABC-type transporter Mla subunit MlaD